MTDAFQQRVRASALRDGRSRGQLKGRKFVRFCFDAGVQEWVRRVGIAASESIGRTSRGAIAAQAPSPLDHDVIIAGRRTFAERTTHEIKRAVRANDPHNHRVVEFCRAVRKEKRRGALGRPAVTVHFAGDRINALIVTA